MVLWKAITKCYEKVRNLKEEHAIQKTFEEKDVKCSRKKTQIIRECLNVDQGPRAHQKGKTKAQEKSSK